MDGHFRRDSSCSGIPENEYAISLEWGGIGKTGSGNHGNEFLRAMEELLAAGVTAWRNNGFGGSQVSV